jgi:hypothetical protein
MKIYVGGALTHAPLEYRQYLSDLREKLSLNEKIEILLFHSNPLKLGGGEHKDVYLKDIHDCVLRADIMIADCTYPSIGLGWEIGAFVESHKKPVLALAKEGSTVSRLLLGAECEKNLSFSFKYYKTEDEAINMAEKYIGSFLER